MLVVGALTANELIPHHTVLCFEVDDPDPELWQGYSVDLDMDGKLLLVAFAMVHRIDAFDANDILVQCQRFKFEGTAINADDILA